MLTGICFSQELERQQKESLLADIAKLNVQIAQTDSLTKAEQKFNAEQAACNYRGKRRMIRVNADFSVNKCQH